MILFLRVLFQRGLLFLVFGIEGLLAASDTQAAEINRSAQFHSTTSAPRPMADLPALMVHKKGGVTLFADYKNASDTGVPLYLTNDTSEELSFGSQDRDIYVKLEYKNDEGEWSRAQAHISSFCGNSYVSVIVPARHFVTFKGYRSVPGKTRAIRYKAMYNDELVSNEGVGLVDETDVIAAGLDHLSLEQIPNAVCSLLECHDRIPQSTSPSLSLRAEAARALRLCPKNPAALALLRRLRDKVSLMSASAEREAALIDINETLQYVWPQRVAMPNIGTLCLNQISMPTGPSAHLSQRLGLSILSGMLRDKMDHPRNSSMREAKAWTPVIPACVAVLNQYSDHTSTYPAVTILKTKWVTDAIVSNTDLATWLRSSSVDLQQCAVWNLNSRGRIDEAITIGKSLPGSQKLIVLHAMIRYANGATSGASHEGSFELGSTDQAFANDCMNTMPLATALAIEDAIPWDSGPQYARWLSESWFHDPLSSFLTEEAKRGKAEAQVAGVAKSLPQIIRMLDKLNDPADNMLLEALLNHGGYERGSTSPFLLFPYSEPESGWDAQKIYTVRKAAADALHRRKIETPKDLVLYDPPLEKPMSRRRVLLPLPGNNR